MPVFWLHSINQVVRNRLTYMGTFIFFSFDFFKFDVEKVNKNSTRLKTELLDECNRLELIRHIKDPSLCVEIIKQIQELIKQNYPKQ